MGADLAQARELDRRDPLAPLRNEFVIADPDLIYLDGNSLGRMPRAARAVIDSSVNGWSDRLIRTWSDGAFQLAQTTGAQIARLIGARPDEVIVAESTSVNLFKLVVAALKAQVGRSRILTDDMNFPSDLYVLEGAVQLLDQQHEVDIIHSVDAIHGPEEALVEQLDARTALLTLTHTAFKSAYVYDMAAVTAAAHSVGALTLWDLSHSAGAMPLDLNGSNVDLAVGCCYKYLNGGPGAPAFLYVRRDLQERLRNPISGWLSQKYPFDFALEYRPQPGIGQFLTGTPTILSMAPIGVGVEMLLRAGMDALRTKSLALSEFLISLWQERLAPYGFTLNSPREALRRGSHVSLGHPEGWRINQAMIHDMELIPDFRAPDNIRIGITPLYTSFEEICVAVERIQQIMERRLYEKYSNEKSTVT